VVGCETYDWQALSVPTCECNNCRPVGGHGLTLGSWCGQQAGCADEDKTMQGWPRRPAGRSISYVARTVVLIPNSRRKAGLPLPLFTIILQQSRTRLGSSGAAIVWRRQILSIPGSLIRVPDPATPRSSRCLKRCCRTLARPRQAVATALEPHSAISRLA
jgi:hypothetical protein